MQLLELFSAQEDPWSLDQLALLSPDNEPTPQPATDLDPLWSQLTQRGLDLDPSFWPPRGLDLPPSPSPSTSASIPPPPPQQTQPNAPQPWTPPDIFEMGYQDANGDWRCKHSGCRSDRIFMRACDLRKHYRMHQRKYFCKEQGCPSSVSGFSPSKDCRRHMRSHQPIIQCLAAESMGCTRVFSRVERAPPQDARVLAEQSISAPMQAQCEEEWQCS
ncbi:hypothetical protein BDW66DRAFT_167609 [Aspergillus desertorum]